MFRRKPPAARAPAEWLIVGLGNPGPQYRATRHNVGFETVDLLARRNAISVNRGKHRAQVGLGLIAAHEVVLAKPMTYMNLSGQSVLPLSREHGLKANRILVIADDLDMKVGKLRLRAKGSAGGHNGHKSIIDALRTAEYPRLKIGIGKGDSETIQHVLGAFDQDEKPVILEALEAAAQVCEALVAEGWEAALKIVEEHNRSVP